MKVVLLLFFSFGMPLVLFLATVLYGPNSNESLKKSLVDSGVYKKIHVYLSENDSESLSQKELFSSLVSRRFQPEYIQSKTELALDQSTDWISEKSQTPPVIDFRELKSDLREENPEILQYLENLPKYAKTAANEEGMDESLKNSLLEQATSISSFVKDDFTLPLERYLQIFKDAMKVIQYALPILAILTIGCLFGLGKSTHSKPSALRWIGAACITSALVGFGILFSYTSLFSLLTQWSFDQTGHRALLGPIFLAIIQHNLTLYLSYQQIVSFVLIFVGAGCFVGAGMMMLPIKAAPPKKTT